MNNEENMAEPLDGARLREEYDNEDFGTEEKTVEDVADEVSNFLLQQLYENTDKDYSYDEVLFGLNKAYLQVLLQMVEDSGYKADEFLDYFYGEAEKIYNDYLEENSEDFDPVKATGSLALAAAYVFGALDE